MASVKFPSSNSRVFFDQVYQYSKIFKDVVDTALLGGDITYVFTDQTVSFYDDQKRIVSIGLKTGDGSNQRASSDVIFEMCNAYCAQKGFKPKMSDHEDPLEYGKETESSEWMAALTHFTIFNELEKLDSGWGQYNRFKPGFLRKEKTWFDFYNYLEEQLKSGHTDLIMSHHPKYKKSTL
jgi:hypothetical protein